VRALFSADPAVARSRLQAFVEDGFNGSGPSGSDPSGV
jgi:hypothetical protein